VITTQPLDLTPADTSSSVRITLADSIRKRYSDMLGNYNSRVRRLMKGFG